jgi:hypothetical protein
LTAAVRRGEVSGDFFVDAEMFLDGRDALERVIDFLAVAAFIFDLLFVVELAVD